MESVFFRQYFQLPSIKGFVKNILESLSNRISVLILLPRQIDAELIAEEIQGQIYRSDMTVELIDLGKQGINRPADFRNVLYRAKWEAVDVLRTTHSYLKRAENLPETLVILGLNDLAKDDRDEWMRFLRDWSLASQQLKNEGFSPSALCFIAKAEGILDMIPAEDLCLTIHWWWKIPSILETQMLCRVVEMEEGERTSLSEWREHLIPSLSLGDLRMVEFLWERVSERSDRILASLHEYSQTSADGPGSYSGFPDLGSRNGRHSTGFPDADLIPYWASGNIQATLEHGVEASTLGLARCERTDELLHRIWRAEVDLLLPQIDNARWLICKKITDLKGEAWPYLWEEPESEYQRKMVRESSLAAELGYLNHLIHHNENFRDCARWKRLVWLAHRIRNEIAHYRPVDFVDYKDFLEEMEAVL